MISLVKPKQAAAAARHISKQNELDSDVRRSWRDFARMIDRLPDEVPLAGGGDLANMAELNALAVDLRKFALMFGAMLDPELLIGENFGDGTSGHVDKTASNLAKNGMSAAASRPTVKKLLQVSYLMLSDASERIRELISQR